MRTLKLTIILIFVTVTLPAAAHCQQEPSVKEKTIHKFEDIVPYEEGKQIYFEDIVITYKGSVLEDGHEKFTSEVFEVMAEESTKTITIPPLSIMGGIVFRFGIHFYELDTLKGRTLTVKKPGFWKSFSSIF